MNKILIVDDDAKIRKIYTSLLVSEGFKPLEAPGPAAANEILKKEHIDLVLLDIRMPEVEGDILYEIMQVFHKGVKVIVASVYPLDEQKHIIEGALDYYDKSQGVDILLKKIRGALEGKKRQKKKVLIVDDEPRTRSLFHRQLKEAGYCVVEAEDGEAAVQLLKKKNGIELVILDIFLPNSSGMDVFEKIRENYPCVKVIISSVYSKVKQESLIWHADDYYYKADDLSVLVGKVGKLINS